MSEWIKVKTRKPSHGQKILVFREGRSPSVQSAIYWKSSMCGAGFYCGIKLDFVTHWMTHPDEPKVKA